LPEVRSRKSGARSQESGAARAGDPAIADLADPWGRDSRRRRGNDVAHTRDPALADLADPRAKIHAARAEASVAHPRS
jgi:hypothetical protein